MNKTESRSQEPGARRAAIRRALLAQVHIARKELGLLEDDYRDILRAEFGPATAADLSIGELQRLVERFRSKGWKGKNTVDRRQETVGKRGDQVEALRERIGQVVLHSDFDEVRLRGLVRKICGVEDLRWVREPVRLKRVLAVIGSMMESGKIEVRKNTVDSRQ